MFTIDTSSHSDSLVLVVLAKKLSLKSLNLDIFIQDDVKVFPILTPQAPISHFKTCIGPEFIKMIQKNNKIKYIYFYLCWRGGKINQPGQLAPRG